MLSEIKNNRILNRISQLESDLEDLNTRFEKFATRIDVENIVKDEIKKNTRGFLLAKSFNSLIKKNEIVNFIKKELKEIIKQKADKKELKELIKKNEQKDKLERLASEIKASKKDIESYKKLIVQIDELKKRIIALEQKLAEKNGGKN